MIEHAYISTACLHNQHGSCAKHCKFCDASCLCQCHYANDIAHLQTSIDAVLKAVSSIRKQETTMAASMQDVQQKIQTLTQDVQQQTSVTQSAVTLLNGVTTTLQTVQQQLKDAVAANDPAAIQAASDALDAATTTLTQNTDQLAQAVSANTPQNPNPTPQS